MILHLPFHKLIFTCEFLNFTFQKAKLLAIIQSKYPVAGKVMININRRFDYGHLTQTVEFLTLDKTDNMKNIVLMKPGMRYPDSIQLG